MASSREQSVSANGSGSFRHSIAVRLFLWLFGVTIVAFAAFGILSIRSSAAHAEATVYACAKRMVDVIKHSTHHEMLQNRKDGVFHTIRSIAGQSDVESIRIYNKSGEIMFSADESEIGHKVDLQAEACVSCHKEAAPLRAVPSAKRVRVYSRPDGHRVLGLISPIENEPACYNASCHAHPSDRSILGVLDVTISMEAPDALLAVAKRRVVIGGIFVALLTGAFSAIFIGAVVRRPVQRLIADTERVARGDLESRIDVRGNDEMARLGHAFNAMTRDLSNARHELTAWSGKLETRLAEKTEELSRSQREVTHMEKMASLGKLSATVAHELNNPLAGILNYAKLTERTIRESGDKRLPRDELKRYLRLIQKEASRSGDIVKNLLIFARRSGSEFARHALSPILERALMLVRHHLEMASIQLETAPIEGDEHLICDADQIQQALLALMVNAVEAMEAGGKLTVYVTGDATQVKIAITDTGVGIPDEDLPNVFEPFFSSKEGAEGAGLGLAVVYGIVQRHRGRIDISSEVGQGSTFTITLPRNPAIETDDAEGRHHGAPADE